MNLVFVSVDFYGWIFVEIAASCGPGVISASDDHLGSNHVTPCALLMRVNPFQKGDGAISLHLLIEMSSRCGRERWHNTIPSDDR